MLVDKRLLIWRAFSTFKPSFVELRNGNDKGKKEQRMGGLVYRSPVLSSMRMGLYRVVQIFRCSSLLLLLSLSTERERVVSDVEYYYSYSFIFIFIH